MTTRRRVLSAASAAGVALGAGLAVWSQRGPALAAPARTDEPRRVPVDNADVFYSMGAYVARYRFPPDYLKGGKRFVARLNVGGTKSGGPFILLRPGRPAEPLEVTVVCHLTPPLQGDARHMLVSVHSSDGGYNRGGLGLRAADGTGPAYDGLRITNTVGDPRDGFEVFAVTSAKDPAADVSVVLQLETE